MLQIKLQRNFTMKSWALCGGLLLSLSSLARAASTAPAVQPWDELDQLAAKRPVSAADQPRVDSDSGPSAALQGDAFQQAFVYEFQRLHEARVPFEVRDWVLRISKGQYREAAHLWSAIQPKLSEGFKPTAEAGQLYLLWKLDLAQSFTDQWLTFRTSRRSKDNSSLRVLESMMQPQLDQWLLEKGIQLSADQSALVRSWNGKADPIVLNLQALSYLGAGLKGEALLPELPVGNRLRIPLAETVALALAKKENLSKAAEVFKNDLEPSIRAQNDPRGLSHYYLQMARLLYQAGYLDGAEQAYLKIPTGTREFLPAQEEITWVWLRKGDLSHLRGHAETLSSKMFRNEFSPEVFLIRAIANLKLCHFDEMRKDFKNFLEDNSHWAKVITSALRAPEPPAPQNLDYTTRRIVYSLARRQAEFEALQKLGEESITATLPAVGWQSHWKVAADVLRGEVGDLTKLRNREYVRHWQNEELALTEAIRKMRFVKIELLTELNQLKSVAAVPASDEVHVSQAAARRDQADMNFPFDGVVWPDEMFKLQAVAESQCQNMRNTK